MSKKCELLNKRFGKLVVVEEYGRNKYKNVVWKCKCDCGNISYVASKDLNCGAVKSCGCEMKKHQFQRKELTRNLYDLDLKEYGIGYYNNKKFLFDKEDFNKINKFYWTIQNGDYVKSNYLTDGTKLDSTVRLHIVIMNSDPKRYDVDHINHNILDNRKQNLRIVKHAENLMNTKLYSNNTSGVKGVYWDKSRNKWMVCITAYKHTYHLGRFDDYNEAVRVRLQAEEKYHKDFYNKDLR